MTCVLSEDSDQPGHPPSLIRVFAVRMKENWVLSYPLVALRRRWSAWADAQADLSRRWAHRSFSWFCHEASHFVARQNSITSWIPEQMSRDMTKPTNWLCDQRRLRSAWAAKDPSFLHADSEDSDQTVRMPRLIWVFAGRTVILLVLSCRGSNIP